MNGFKIKRGYFTRAFISWLVILFFHQTVMASPQGKTVGASGNPIPRFVSIAHNEANMRTGPNLDYPIKWVYKRKDLPLKVIDEYGPWRKVKDQDGTIGWMHVQILSGKRTVILTEKVRRLYKKPSISSRVKMIADAGVIGYLKKCDLNWCHIEIDGAGGWIEKNHIYGHDQDL